MRYVPRKRMTVEIEVELRKGINKENLLAAIESMPLLNSIRHQAQIIDELVIDHKKD